MTKGAGLIGLLYSIKDLIQGFAMTILTGVGVVLFFWLIVQYIITKTGKSVFGIQKVEGKSLFYAIFLLFVILAIYALIGLTAAIFGVNSSPSGGLLVK